MENFYELFEVIPSASIKEIMLSYENKITKFNNIHKLSQKQIYEIKLLKSGLYILLNPELRYKYNIYLENKRKQLRQSNQEPVAINQQNDLTLDELFNVDNTWMKNMDKNTDNDDSKSRKTKFETNVLGDRIFSMSQYQKRPGFSTDNEIELRKPMQGREEKK